jgi:hypothetical protein
LGNGKKGPRRFPLVDGDNQPICSLTPAREALEIKWHERRQNKLPTAGRKPLLPDYCETYFQKARVQRKRPGTVENERQATARWRDFLGLVRVDRISTPGISAYIDKRLKGGVFGGRKLEPVSERTVNIDLMVLRNVLKAAIDDGHLRELPRIKLLDEPPSPKRQLITPAEFKNLIKAARTACAKNGEQLADYLQFLAFSGCREKETLRVFGQVWPGVRGVVVLRDRVVNQTEICLSRACARGTPVAPQVPCSTRHRSDDGVRLQGGQRCL